MKRLDAFFAENTYRLVGKTVAVSGATGGLGREICKRLCELGASLILLDRNRERSLALIGELSAEYGKNDIEHITLELEDMAIVRSVAEELAHRKIDYLILNAGAYSIPRHRCATGYDNVFQINFASQYCLARTLLPQIAKRGGKVVAVGSIAHNYSRIDSEDIDFSTRRAASRVYGNAKRHLMFALWGLEEYRKNITVVHPGITVTNITAHYPKPVYALIKYPMKVLFAPPRKACMSVVCGLFADCVQNEWIGPRIFDIWGMPKKRLLHTCKPSEARAICERADRIYKELS